MGDAVTAEQTVLGEGARWDAQRDELLRVDILAGRVFRDRVLADGSLEAIRTYQLPHIVGAIGILFLFSQSGMIARIAHMGGLISKSSEFPAMVWDKYAIGIIIEYLWKTVPFTGVILLAVLQSVGEDYEDVARSLGANRWQRLWNVIIPLVMPGLLRASILVFAFTFGAFEIPFLLGQRYPSALPVLAYRSYHDVDLNARPEAMAMMMVIAALIMILILIYMKLTETYVRSD
jgi:putative spermidine/putrescine transport system permease protein